jgi:hypothetical protein
MNKFQTQTILVERKNGKVCGPYKRENGGFYALNQGKTGIPIGERDRMEEGSGVLECGRVEKRKGSSGILCLARADERLLHGDSNLDFK